VGGGKLSDNQVCKKVQTPWKEKTVPRGEWSNVKQKIRGHPNKKEFPGWEHHERKLIKDDHFKQALLFEEKGSSNQKLRYELGDKKKFNTGQGEGLH